MTTTMTALPDTATAPVPVRRTGPSPAALVGIELRKSLSTRSGKALAVAATLLAPAATTLVAAASSEELDSVTGPLAVMGLLSGYLLITLGVLSTAGEWSHRTVQTTFLLVPRRGRVLAAKATAVALLGAAFSAVATALTAGVLAVTTDASWDGAPRTMAVAVVAGVVFAVSGAGVGAALANTPAALVSIYLTLLGVIPIVLTFKPAVGEKVDPASAVLNLAQGAEQAQSIAVLVGWVVVPAVVGWVLTHRRAVQ